MAKTKFSRFLGFQCPVGHYCPTGSGYPRPCEPGTFSKEVKQASCDDCTPGYQCIGVANLTACPEGFYCPAGTGYDLQPCPPGTFKNTTLGSDISACVDCPGGFYCDGEATTNPVKLCKEGYYCRNGVNTSEPGTSPHTGDGGRCPAGSYCPVGTGSTRM
uniref:spore coat protein SP87-like n=1 Tax=Styela clava TaxID=7725 RepID=UPI0019396956|nr:spore coat protein SP87-like [Styela clava]